MLTIEDLGRREVTDASACLLILFNRIDDFLTEVEYEAEIGWYSPQRANEARAQATAAASLLLSSHKQLLLRISGSNRVDRWERWVQKALASTTQPDIDREGEDDRFFPPSRALGEARTQARLWLQKLQDLLETGSIRDIGSAPSAFVSYCRQPPSHAEWVLKMATALRERKRVDVMLDEWDLLEGESIGKYVEESINASDFVIVVCTPEYKKKADTRKGGVGQEAAIISARMYDRVEAKALPILRGPRKDSWPNYLSDRLAIDFSQEESFETSLDRLSNAIHGNRIKPTLGGSPDSGKSAP